MKKFIQEFKEFALKGNVMDLAIAVLIGGAFSSVITALTEDIISPFLNLFASPESNLGWVISLGPGEGQQILIGAFISTVINFFIHAFIIFLIIKMLNKLSQLGKKKKSETEETKEDSIPEDIQLLTEIRDLLKNK